MLHTCKARQKAWATSLQRSVLGWRMAGWCGGDHATSGNAAFLLDALRQETSSLRAMVGCRSGLIEQPEPPLTQECVILDRDLNRSFQPALLEDPEKRVESQEPRQIARSPRPELRQSTCPVLELYTPRGDGQLSVALRPPPPAWACIRGLLGPANLPGTRR